MVQRPDRGSARTGRAGRLAAVAVGAAMVVTSIGCGSSGDGAATSAPEAEPTTEPQPGGQLVLAVPLTEGETTLRMALEPLTTFAADGSVANYLAESVEPNDDFDRWTIRVRPDITFHNGEALDAEAVKANLDTYSVDELYGTDPFAPIVATTVVDDLTVEVEMDRPWSTFPAALTAEQSDGTGLMAAPATLEAAGALFLANPGTTEVFGTGPFILEASTTSAGGFSGKKNPDYWQEGLPYVDAVDVIAIPDRASRLQEVDEGDVDVAIMSSPPDEAGTSQVFVPEGEAEVLAIAMNTRRAPLDDATVREALALGTDVESLAATAGIDASMIAAGPFGPGSAWGDPSAQPVDFDPDRASELVAAYEEANGPISIRLGAQGLEIEDVAVQQEVSQQWADIGIDVDISVVDPFIQTANLLVTADFDAVMGSLFGNPDPDLNYFWWHSSALKTETKGAGYNYVGLDDPELDGALDTARSTLDEDERRAAMVAAQQRIDAAQPYVWLWATPWGLVANDRVRGFDTTPLPDGGVRMAMVGPILNLEGIWFEQ